MGQVRLVPLQSDEVSQSPFKPDLELQLDRIQVLMQSGSSAQLWPLFPLHTPPTQLKFVLQSAVSLLSHTPFKLDLGLQIPPMQVWAQLAFTVQIEPSGAWPPSPLKLDETVPPIVPLTVNVALFGPGMLGAKLTR